MVIVHDMRAKILGSACASHAGDGALAIANFVCSCKFIVSNAFRRGLRNVDAGARAVPGKE